MTFDTRFTPGQAIFCSYEEAPLEVTFARYGLTGDYAEVTTSMNGRRYIRLEYLHVERSEAVQKRINRLHDAAHLFEWEACQLEQE
jgi:hypothetical protein